MLSEYKGLIINNYDIDRIVFSNINDTVMIITSEFHLKRCDAIIKKYIPGIHTILVKVLDGVHDRDCWFMNDMIWNNNGQHGSGKTLVINEANILINGAYNGELKDFEV